MKDYLPKNWREMLAWCVTVAAITFGVSVGCLPKDTPVPPPPLPIFEPTDAQANGGWVNDPDAVNAIQAKLDFKVFADTDAGKADDPLPPFVYLWQSYTKLFGRAPPSKNQADIGSCVSFGTNNAVCRTLATQIVLAKGSKDEFKDIAEEVTYGGSRVQVGGGRIRGDGSVGAWAAEFVKKWGVVARDKHGRYDLTTYSVATCRKFGQSGCPADLEPIAKERPVKTITLVKTWSDAKKSLASGYAIAICSGQGFSMQRDANGVCRPSGSWAHCMCLDGYASINGKEHGHIVNSWGDKAHTGPVGPGEPPPCGFWADSAVISRMLAQNDSWEFSGVTGFPKRELDWFVQVEPRVPPPRYAQLKEVHYALSP